MKTSYRIIMATLLILALVATATAKDLTLTNKKIAGAFAQAVFVKKDLSSVDKYMRADYIQHNPLVEQGSKGFKEFFSNWFDCVPDWKYSVKKIVAEGNEVWVYGTYSGTLEKDWLGVPATGQKYAFDVVDIFRLQKGQLAEHWDVMDVYKLFKQLGAIK